MGELAMSEYGFGEYDDDMTTQGQQPPSQEPSGQSPKWFRDYMKKTSQEMAELRQKLTEKEVAETLRSKGYNPGAAALYSGDPTKVDEWLTAHGDVLAKLPSLDGSTEPEPEVPAGPPATIVSPESQATMARMQAAGTEGAAPSQSGDQDLAAKLRACNTREEYEAVMRAQGSPYYS